MRGFSFANLKSRVCEECKKERAARAVTTDRQLFTAVRALPHMAITKKEGEYRVTFRLASIVEADQGRHDADWHRDHAERVAYYTDDRDDALGSAKSLSDNMVRVDGEVPWSRVPGPQPSECRPTIRVPADVPAGG